MESALSRVATPLVRCSLAASEAAIRRVGSTPTSTRLIVGLFPTRCQTASLIGCRLFLADAREDRERVLRLTSLSFAHPEVLSDRRAQLSLSGNLLHRAHGRLHATGHPAFLLSTCLRVEIAWAGGPETTSDVLACLYGDGSPSDLGEVRSDQAALCICAGLPQDWIRL